MFKRLHFPMLSLSFAILVFLPTAAAQDMTISEIQKLELAGNDVIEVESNSTKGFNFPYYLFIPEQVDRSGKVYLFVETNNTGTTSDDFEVHRKRALNLVTRSYPNRIARNLHVPLTKEVWSLLKRGDVLSIVQTSTSFRGERKITMMFDRR